MHFLKRILLSFLAVILIFEEWIWDALTLLGRKLAVWLHLEPFEAWLRQTTPPIALIAFIIPVLVVTPFNIAAFWIIAHGLILRGILLEIFAKLLGTVLIARIFALTKPQLLSFAWFRAIYRLINGWIIWAHLRLSNTAVYKAAHRLKSLVLSSFAWFKKN